MGWRSIRLSFEHPDLFLKQIRAVMRAAHGTDKEVRLLFPMVTAWDELQQVKSIVEHARHQLQRNRIPCGPVRVGIMIEVPAAAVMIDHLIEQVDYVCVGTNDLVQYMTAADRDNPKVSHLCQSLSPAVLRVLSSVIRCCVEAGKPVTVCGEMAGSPRAFPLLLAMGLRSFSMSPAFIPVIRDLAGRLSRTDATEMLADVSRVRSSSEIHEILDSHLGRISPHLLPLLTAQEPVRSLAIEP
jgi:phosphotransferase system enzyme I (PtsI)